MRTEVQANLLNSLTLIALGLWGYFDVNATSEKWEWTPLIPVFFGVILFLCNNGLKKENKIISHVAVVLTLLVIIGLIKPLTGAIERVDNMAIMRIALMIFTSILVMITFIRSFIIARRK